MYNHLTNSDIVHPQKKIDVLNWCNQMQTGWITPLYVLRHNDPAARTMNIYLPANAAKSITSSLKHATQNG